MVLKPCGKCSIKIQTKAGKQDKQIKCDLCAEGFHQACAEVTDTICDEMNKVEGLKWYCSTCRKAIDSLLLNVDVIKSFEKKMQRMEEEANRRITKLEDDMKKQTENMKKIEGSVQKNEEKVEGQKNKMKESIEEAIEKTYARKAAEGIERVATERFNFRAPVNHTAETTDEEQVPVVDENEERRRSIITHNMKESTDDDTEVRIQYDTDKVVEVCKYLGNHEFSEYSIEKIFRLGKKETGKVRPLKVCLNDNITKFKIIRNTHKLRESEYEDISIQHDLSKDQRDELSAMIKIAQRKEEEDPTGNYIYRVRGPPGRKYIKRIRKPVVAEVEVEEEANQESQTEPEDSDHE